MTRRLPFLPQPGGQVRLTLGRTERQVLTDLVARAGALVEQRARGTERLFPTAYPGDQRAEEEYRQLMGPELLRAHRQALDTMSATIGATVLTEAELHQWLAALEVLRLVLGTELDVTEDDEIDPAHPPSWSHAVYLLLTGLQAAAVDALSLLLPDAGDPTR